MKQHGKNGPTLALTAEKVPISSCVLLPVLATICVGQVTSQINDVLRETLPSIVCSCLGSGLWGPCFAQEFEAGDLEMRMRVGRQWLVEVGF